MPTFFPFAPHEAVVKVERRVRVVREPYSAPIGTAGTVIGVSATHRAWWSSRIELTEKAPFAHKAAYSESFF